METLNPTARRVLAVAAPALLLAACGTTPIYPTTPVPPVVQAPPPPPQPGSILGRSAVRLSSGAHVSCAGFSVALMPDNPKYRRRVLALYGTTAWALEPVGEVKARSAAAPPSPDTPPIASASCDAHGGFSFVSLPPSGYFLIAHVKVKPPENGHDDYVILKPVSISPGELLAVALTP